MLTGPAVTTLLQRIRDPHGLGTSRDLARTLLDRAQPLVNLGLGDVLDRSTMTVRPFQMVYSLSGEVRRAGRLVGVQDADGRDLPLVRWDTLKAISRTWFRQVDDALMCAAPLGRDAVILFPAVRAETTVTIVSAKLTAPLTDDFVPLEVPEETAQIVLDLAELFALLRQRSLAPALDLMGRLVARVSGFRRVALEP